MEMLSIIKRMDSPKTNIFFWWNTSYWLINVKTPENISKCFTVLEEGMNLYQQTKTKNIRAVVKRLTDR